MEFKKLEIEQERGLINRIFKSKQTRRSVFAVLIGVLAGFLFFYFTEGKFMDELLTVDILKSMALGGFFGFFIVNSPCARGRC
jgi:uncharacterized membrane protein YraQ (UPF0718 family)